MFTFDAAPKFCMWWFLKVIAVYNLKPSQSTFLLYSIKILQFVLYFFEFFIYLWFCEIMHPLFGKY